jgi:hypothetical protein
MVMSNRKVIPSLFWLLHSLATWSCVLYLLTLSFSFLSWRYQGLAQGLPRARQELTKSAALSPSPSWIRSSTSWAMTPALFCFSYFSETVLRRWLQTTVLLPVPPWWLGSQAWPARSCLVVKLMSHLTFLPRMVCL